MLMIHGRKDISAVDSFALLEDMFAVVTIDSSAYRDIT